jgi:UDP-glucose 4-epimerase
MRLLVTGSEGSLAQWIIPLLLEHGHEVVGVDNFSRYGQINRARNYRFLKRDLTDPKAVKEVCRDVDAIIQAAAQIYGVKGFHKFPADILSKDIVLHQNLLWEAINRGMARMVYISSSMVYERATQVPVREVDTDQMQIPFTDYGLSKLVGERLCQAFGKQYGLDFTIWRPFNIITPYEKAGEESGISHVFADLIHKIVIKKQNPVEILGDGEQVRCFTWIGDVASAIADYSFLDITRDEIFNLGNPQRVTIKQLGQKIFEKALKRGAIADTAKLSFTHEPVFEDDVRVRVPSIEKAQSMLHWNPTITLDEALDRCIDEALKYLHQ